MSKEGAMTTNPDTPGISLTPELHVRKSMDLCVTVVGRQLEDQILEMVDSGDEITLNCDETVSLVVSNVSRADGLPMGVEKMFEEWFKKAGLRDSLKESAKIAYFSGMKAGGGNGGEVFGT